MCTPYKSCCYIWTFDIFLLVHGQTVHDAEVKNSQSKIIFLEMLSNLGQMASFLVFFPYMNEFVKYLLFKRWKDQHLLGSTERMQQMPSGRCHNKLIQQLWWWCRRCFQMCGWVFVNLENQMSLLQKELKSQQLARSLNQWKRSTDFRNCSRCTHVLYMKDAISPVGFSLSNSFFVTPMLFFVTRSDQMWMRERGDEWSDNAS